MAIPSWGTTPSKKTLETTKLDESESEVDSDFANREVFIQEEDIPSGLKILEQYGVFGASPGAWTSKVAHKAASLA
eukprot:CAMPEP_0197650740 /NCGR_PEP_ID=MMETSP1338-20131121/31128_1 /TAXON_ID=43686 ORGANISM="Pelagodinium beii, Strain RCC1491" /NCGR_SAMPLE_ID=MMETSP1338 /ASSEMBLY_ACC=CAM_ASM_000754 /LENGTH=75 /DNA_ID=CAMNT_0043225207 /DNA_START=146 /DNA_END=373 /DNA_ORIENTATION=+